MMIIKKDDRTCGSPKMTFVNTGQNSEKEPAGSKYAIVFFRLSKTTLPYCKASTTALNDSRRTISAASIAISEPLPRAIPISAALREGASLTPSPVIPTISSRLWNSCTIRSFCSGVVRAKTISSYLQSFSHWSSLRVINSGPLKTIEVLALEDTAIAFFSGSESEIGTASSRERAEIPLTVLGGFVMIPHSVAIACAVRAKSPVTYQQVSKMISIVYGARTMKIRIPAPRKIETTEGISSRGGSTIPTMPTKIRSDLA